MNACVYVRLVAIFCAVQNVMQEGRTDRTEGRQEKQLQSAFASNYSNPQQQPPLQELVGALRADTRTNGQTENICSCQRLQINYNKMWYAYDK